MNEAEWLSSADPAAMLTFLRSDGDDGLGRFYASDRKLRLFAVACVRQAWDGTPCPGTRAGPCCQTKLCPICLGSGRVNALTDPRSRRAVEVAERFADGEAMEAERDAAYLRAVEVFEQAGPMRGSFEAELVMRTLAHVSLLTENAGLPRWFSVSTKLAAAQAALLRDIFGNPFRPVKLPRPRQAFIAEGIAGDIEFTGPATVILEGQCPWLAWNDGTVRKLARAIYEERAFDRLPLLADALEEAGCADAAILNHCRGACDYPGCLSGWIMRTDGRLGADPCRRCRDVQGKPIPPVRVRGDWVVDMLLGKE